MNAELKRDICCHFIITPTKMFEQKYSTLNYSWNMSNAEEMFARIKRSEKNSTATKYDYRI